MAMMMRMSGVWFCSPSIPTIATKQQQLGSISFSLPSTSRVSLSSPTQLRTRRRRNRNRGALTCNALFGLGVPELVVIAGVVALVFGPKKLPEVGRSIGKTVKSFQQAAKEFESEIKKEPDSTGGGQSEKSIAVSEPEKKQETEVSSSKESVSDL